MSGVWANRKYLSFGDVACCRRAGVCQRGEKHRGSAFHGNGGSGKVAGGAVLLVFDCVPLLLYPINNRHIELTVVSLMRSVFGVR